MVLGVSRVVQGYSRGRFFSVLGYLNASGDDIDTHVLHFSRQGLVRVRACYVWGCVFVCLHGYLSLYVCLCV